MKKILLTAVFGSMICSLQAKTAGDISAKASASVGVTFLSSAKHNGELATSLAREHSLTRGANTIYEVEENTNYNVYTFKNAGYAEHDDNGYNAATEKTAREKATIKDLKKKTSFSTVLALEGDYSITDSVYAGLAFNYNFCNANVRMNDRDDSKLQIRGMYGLTAKVGYEYSNFDFALSVGYGWANTKVRNVYELVTVTDLSSVGDNSGIRYYQAPAGMGEQAAFPSEATIGTFNDENKKIEEAGSSWKKKGSVMFGADINYRYNDAVSFGVKYQGQKVQTKQYNTDNKLKAWAHTVALTACYHM